MRRLLVGRVVVCALALAACSSDGAEPGDGRPSPAPVTDDSAAVGGDASPVTTSPSGLERGEREQGPAYSVAVDVSVDSLDLSDRLEVAIDPGRLSQVDPFTYFNSCSGLRASVGTYAVTVVDDTEDTEDSAAAVRSVSVVTADSVEGPGIHDAEVTVETATAGTVDAVGTMTLDQNLRSGSFQAFGSTGERVSGTFVCDGPPGSPVPITDVEPDVDGAGDVGGGDGVLRIVEVVTLLRRGVEERIVGLTLDTAELTVADADCPAVTGSDAPVLVSVDGSPAVGAITAFELAPDRSPDMQMQVGGVVYEVDVITVDVDDGGTAGTFSGVTVDGIVIDGAFRCA